MKYCNNERYPIDILLRFWYNRGTKSKGANTMAKIGYIRVSTTEQNTDRQEINLQNCDKLFIEKVSGKDTEHRTELKKLMEYVREDDIVVVDSFSRFARNTKDLLSLVEQLQNKGVSFVSLKENIDTTTPQGKFMLTVFAGLAQFEREQTLERQREGIEIAKRQGKYKGRQRIAFDSDKFASLVKKVKAGEMTATAAMKELNMKPNTFYRRLKELESK